MKLSRRSLRGSVTTVAVSYEALLCEVWQSSKFGLVITMKDDLGPVVKPQDDKERRIFWIAALPLAVTNGEMNYSRSLTTYTYHLPLKKSPDGDFLFQNFIQNNLFCCFGFLGCLFCRFFCNFFCGRFCNWCNCFLGIYITFNQFNNRHWRCVTITETSF